jgi:hypothetical protein
VRLIRCGYRGQASRAGWTSEADLVEGDRTDDVASVLALITGASTRVRFAMTFSSSS